MLIAVSSPPLPWCPTRCVSVYFYVPRKGDTKQTTIKRSWEREETTTSETTKLTISVHKNGGSLPRISLTIVVMRYTRGTNGVLLVITIILLHFLWFQYHHTSACCNPCNPCQLTRTLHAHNITRHNATQHGAHAQHKHNATQHGAHTQHNITYLHT